jgi:Flp pilus assembly protein TadD
MPRRRWRCGDLEAAVREYRAALALTRGEDAATRGLATTLLAVGRRPEAETYLLELLAHHPTDGPLNRAMARIYSARGREGDARAAYQRRIYGEWPGDPLAGRVATRFELVDYLRHLGAREEMLAELLRLKSELPAGDTTDLRRVADLLVHADAVDPAIDALHVAAEATPRDVELLAQLADTESRAGRSTEARRTLRRAVALQPAREDLRDRLAVIERVLALDPTMPRLRLVTRMRRTRQISRPCSP